MTMLPRGTINWVLIIFVGIIVFALIWGGLSR